MDHLPKCDISINMAMYLDRYVDWDIDVEKYISKNKEKERNDKVELVNDMNTNDGKYLKGCLEEFQWLYEVEHDVKVKRLIKKCINNLH